MVKGMRIVGLDLLRGISAFGIVGCHLLLNDRTDAGWFVTSLCDMNVAVFAALSGYVMAFEKWNGWGQMMHVLRMLYVLQVSHRS